jgi:hypothetical protein
MPSRLTCAAGDRDGQRHSRRRTCSGLRHPQVDRSPEQPSAPGCFVGPSRRGSPHPCGTATPRLRRRPERHRSWFRNRDALIGSICGRWAPSSRRRSARLGKANLTLDRRRRRTRLLSRRFSQVRTHRAIHLSRLRFRQGVSRQGRLAWGRSKLGGWPRFPGGADRTVFGLERAMSCW